MIKRFFQNILSRFESKPDIKDPIEKVFSINGVGYYKYKDISKVKCQRVLVINDFMNELAMRATRDFLIAHTEAVDAILTNNTKIDLGSLFKLNQQLQERLEMIYETEIIYKIASVMFFTNKEDPNDYDDLLGREKIALFKQQDKEDKKMGFFFDSLFKSIIGSTTISDQDLQIYMEVGSQITQEHLKTISIIKSKRSVMSA